VTVVIAIGNRFRRDDGVGPAVLDALTRRTPPVAARLIELDGEPARLLSAWTGEDLVVVIDAARGPSPRPGTVHRIELPAGADPGVDLGRGAGTHGLGLRSATALATALGARPERLVVYAVEGADFSHGEGLSPSVGAVVDSVAERIASEVAPAR
jgi:hydrogenase maturation protease